MIDMNKEYTTRDGREVRIYATGGGGHNPVHGAILIEGKWHLKGWNESGMLWDGCDPAPHDLVEKPRTVTRWVNVYKDGSIGTLHDSYVNAKSFAKTDQGNFLRTEELTFDL